MSDFWTRRRAGVLAEDRQAEASAIAEADAARASALAERQAGLSEPELLAELGLPDPDGLVAGDDFSAFLRREVPELLRQRALRRLWASNPVLANLDGLLDHGEDYTDTATVRPAMPTIYRVGRGMVERALKEGEALLAGDAQTAPPPGDPVRRPTAARVVVLPPDGPVAASDPAPAPAVLDEPRPMARHMQFHFTEAGA